MSSKPLARLVRNIEYACKANSRPIVWGPPGIGKSRIIEALAAAVGRRLVTLIGSQVDPTTMYFPVLDPTARTTDLDGRTRPVIQTAPQKLFTDLNDDRRKWILFLDEFTCIPAAVAAAWLKLVVDGTAGDYQLDMRKGWIIAAANSADQAVNGTPLSDPMVNRLAHFKFPVTEQSALEWADGSFVSYWGAPELGWPRDMRPDGLEDDHIVRARSMFSEFVRRVPSVWHPAIPDSKFTYGSGEEGWASARSLDRASRSVAIALSENRPPVTCIDIVEAEIGPAAAVEFQQYVTAADIPDPEAVLAAPDTWKFSGRVDVDYAVMLAVAGAVAARPTMDRVVAGFKVCERSAADRSGAPAKEAAMTAVIRLAPYVTKGSDGFKAVSVGKSAKEIESYVLEVRKVAVPFISYISMSRGES